MSFSEETRGKHETWTTIGVGQVLNLLIFHTTWSLLIQILPMVIPSVRAHSPSSPSIDASSLQAQRSLSFVDRHGHVDMPSRRYQPPSRPPAVIAQDKRSHPDDHCPPGKRHQFEGFMGCDKVETALAQDELYYGRLRINAKPVDAFVTYDALDSDVFVCNACRNRALEGDLMAIQ
ncbi:hypothetical protein DM01DRAFT_348375, partial [Hesseltinella vesiculosa]